MNYTREHLIQVDYEGDQFSECLLCGGYGEIEKDIHEEGCPFADPEVDQVKVLPVKRMADHKICGRCQRSSANCPPWTNGHGWALTTHARLLKMCDRYRKISEK